MSDWEPQPPIAYDALPQPGNGLAVAALVLGIISLVLLCIPYISIPCGILGIVFGAIGCKRTRAGASGGGMAKAGLTCGCISVGLAVLLVVLAFAGCALFGTHLPGFMYQIQEAAEKSRPSGLR